MERFSAPAGPDPASLELRQQQTLTPAHQGGILSKDNVKVDTVISVSGAFLAR
jgi:hypothetical protein